MEIKTFMPSMAAGSTASDPRWVPGVRGDALQELKHLNAAITNYDRAISIKPEYAEAYWNKSLALLLCGDFQRGWELYEWR